MNFDRKNCSRNFQLAVFSWQIQLIPIHFFRRFTPSEEYLELTFELTSTNFCEQFSETSIGRCFEDFGIKTIKVQHKF